MKTIKLFSALICALILAPQAWAQGDYGIKFDSDINAYVANWKPEKVKSTTSGAPDILKAEIYYLTQKKSAWFYFTLFGETQWLLNYAKRIKSNNRQLKNQTMKIGLSNGSTLTTTGGIAMINQVTASLLGEGSKYTAMNILFYPHLCYLPSEQNTSGYTLHSRTFSLLRTYDVTSLTVDGHTFYFSGSNTAYHFNNMLNQISNKVGHSSGMGSKIVPTSVTWKATNVDFDVMRNGKKGMNIKLSFSTEGLKSTNCQLRGYFYFQSGGVLKDYNQQYRTSDGNVSVSADICPGYDNAVYTDYTIFMPYDELHLVKTAGESYKLKFYFMLYNKAKGEFVGNYSQSDNYNFTISY